MQSIDCGCLTVGDIKKIRVETCTSVTSSPDDTACLCDFRARTAENGEKLSRISG